MRTTIFLLLIINYSLLIAQSQWQRTIGQTGVEEAYSIIQTADLGYAVAGYTESFGAGNADVYIVKLNSIGIPQWSRTLGGPYYDYAFSIVQTRDGGYAVGGYSAFYGATNDDIYLAKLNSSGSLQWSRLVGGTNLEFAYSLIQTRDSGYAVTGYAVFTGIIIMKLDANGTLQWSRGANTPGVINARSIIQTTDGGYAVAGYAQSSGTGSLDIYIGKLDAVGTFQWTRTVGGIADDRAFSVVQTADGGYAIAGYTNSFGAGGLDIYIVKLDASGSLQWTRTIGGTNNDAALSIVQTTDAGLVVAGFTYSFGAGYDDLYIVKLNASGVLQWSKTVGGTSPDRAYSIIQVTDGGYLVVGKTQSFAGGGMFIVKLDANGNTCANSTSPPSQTGTGGTITSSTFTFTSPTPTVTTPTPTVSSGGTVTTICFVGIQPISNQIPASFELYQNYPNPFNSNSKIKMQISKLGNVKLVIFDALGREIEMLVNDELKPGAYEVEWDASNYPSGVYYYRLTASEYGETKRMVLIK